MMEYKQHVQSSAKKVKPRLIIHGGAGNIKPTNLTPERYKAVRESLLGMVLFPHVSHLDLIATFEAKGERGPGLLRGVTDQRFAAYAL